MSRQIIVADRGHVLIGEVTETPTGITLTDASVIRYWGTSAGLGQLAQTGPTSSTRLDSAGTVHIPLHAIIFMIDVTFAGTWS